MALCLSLLAGTVMTSSAAAACSNPVACENALPGDPASDWQVAGAGDSTIQGFATSMGVNVGQTVTFKINTPSTAYHIDILRLGYYGGAGARKVASNIIPSASLPQTQPSCLTDSSTGLIDCGNWAASASWTVPSNAVSGVYIAHLVRDDPQDRGGASQIPFVVRNDASHSDVLYSTSDATWEAYNSYGGNSTYTCSVACPPGNPLAYKGADAVSYNRPFNWGFSTNGGASSLYYAEYQMIQWLEKNGYDVSYTSSGDVDRAGALLLNHKAFVSSGHDEYWSAAQRANVTAARNAGVNLAFFSGNEMFWKTRWAASEDGSNTPYRTLITYKETHYNAAVDPQDPPTWTGAWADPRFSPPADGGNPQNALTGQQFEINSGTADIQVPAQYAKLGLWRNTAVANLSPGQVLTLDPGGRTLGYEWDEDLDNGFRPPGQITLSSTTAGGLQAFTDYASTVTNGNSTATHHLTLYRAPSGALVFGAGTVQWSWGLDNVNAWAAQGPTANPPDSNMQQFTVNLLADMGAQPGTLTAGLTPAAASTDTAAPTSTITSPSSNGTFADGNAVTISGSATDAGGGVVAGVEVSTNGGSTWHPATLTTADGTTAGWSYSWIAHGSPTARIESRATDDSGNTEHPSAGATVNVTCPCSIWGNNVSPTTADSGDGSSVELGVQFKADTSGQITGVRFYKSAANIGTHVGSLWTSSGTLLSQATFTNETASGWQSVSFASPVAVTAGTTYVAGYLAPNGHYSGDNWYFYTPPPTGGHMIDSPPLHALPATATTANGVYAQGTAPTFPVNTFEGTNYWVDVLFSAASTTAPGQVTGVSATTGPQSATVSWSAPSSGGAPTTYTVTPFIGSTAQTPTVVSAPATSTTITGLTAGTAYTFTVQASNSAGNGPASPRSNSVTPTAASAPGAPTGVNASPASSQALVSWTAPSSSGGSPISGYTITPFIGTTAQAPTQVNNGSATSATVTGLTNGTAYTFKVSATNGTAGAQSSPSATITPEDTIFDFTAPGSPSQIDPGDASSVEVGVKFTASTTGQVTGIRFYKSTANAGTHIGSLWNASGTLLSQATFTSETPSGWQTVLFPSPVSITAGTTYVAGYLDPGGHYSATNAGLSTSVVNGPLTTVANGTSANGVYSYATTPTFPVSTFQGSNYWVDVLFAPVALTAPGQVTGVSATGGAQSATVSWSSPASGGAPTTYTVTPFIGSTAQTPTVVGAPATSTTITGLTAGTTYTFAVQASNSAGNGAASANSNPVTPTGASAPSAPSAVTATPASSQALVSWTAPSSDGGSPISGYTITPFIGTTAQTPTQVTNGSTTSATVTGLTNGTAYTFTVSATNGTAGSQSSPSAAITPEDTIFDFTAPGSPSQIDPGDSSSVEVGVKFTANTSGQVIGVRFYKSAANTGTHIGTLWTTGGTQLAQATFTSETPSGWQTVLFSSPVSITAGTTYVAGYLDPSGHYSATNAGLSSAVVNGPLTAVANSTSANGVYAYATTPTFPVSTFQAENYWVDVLFAPVALTAPGQVTGASATAGAQSATVSWSAPSSGGGPTKYTVTPFIGSTAQTPTSVTGSPPATSTTITGLTAGTTYTFTVQASNSAGNGPASTQSNSVTPTATGPPGVPTSVAASPASGQALVNWTAPSSNGGSPISGYTITPFIGTTAQTPTQVNNGSATSATITGLTNGTAYTFKVSATNGTAGAQSSPSATITPEDTIFDFSTPTTPDSGDSSQVEVGAKFTASSAGQITGIRFYKSAANTGTHIGTLWTAGGTQLAQATFANETTSGWQTVLFSSPVSITAGTTYVAGYLDPGGHYSVTEQGLSSAFSNPPLKALANSTSTNGVYTYATSPTFPNSTFNAENYWVDVLFQP
jgi:hypothetical protein